MNKHWKSTKNIEQKCRLYNHALLTVGTIDHSDIVRRSEHFSVCYYCNKIAIIDISGTFVQDPELLKRPHFKRQSSCQMS